MLAISKRRNDYERENTIGRMDRIITIMEPVVTDGTSNEDKITGFTPIETNPNPRARVEYETGDTVVDQNQAKHVQKTTFTVRYRTDVTIKNKIHIDGKLYSVLSAIPLGEHRQRRTRITGEYLKDYVLT